MSFKMPVNGLRIHFHCEGVGPPLLLLHGYPESHRQWRHVTPLLSKRFTVVAPDYRGAGRSDRPISGYDKKTMATDMLALMKGLGHDRFAVAGHDIGLMIAYALAANARDAVTRLVMMDAPLPGTSHFDRMVSDPRLWHMPFHMVPDVPEMLTAGRERAYLGTFFHSKTLNSMAFSEADIDEYAKMYAAPGAMRAGFEIYRAFPQDCEDNRQSMQQKLTIPVLALGGQGSAGEVMMGDMMREVAENVTARMVPNSGHYVSEENPEFIAGQLLEFLQN